MCRLLEAPCCDLAVMSARQSRAFDGS